MSKKKTDWQGVGIGIGALALLGVGAYALYRFSKGEFGREPAGTNEDLSGGAIMPESGGVFPLPNEGDLGGYSYYNPETGETVDVIGKSADERIGGQIGIATEGIGTAALQVGIGAGAGLVGYRLSKVIGSWLAKRLGGAAIASTAGAAAGKAAISSSQAGALGISAAGPLAIGAIALASWGLASYEAYKGRKELAAIPGAIKNLITQGQAFPVAQPSLKTELALANKGTSVAQVQALMNKGYTNKQIVAELGLGTGNTIKYTVKKKDNITTKTYYMS